MKIRIIDEKNELGKVNKKQLKKGLNNVFPEKKEKKRKKIFKKILNTFDDEEKEILKDTTKVLNNAIKYYEKWDKKDMLSYDEKIWLAKLKNEVLKRKDC